MGKYLRKSKTTGDVVAMDAPQSFLGVRTRAKTLALRNLQQSSACGGVGGGSYLQLRSRNLEKPPFPIAGNGSMKRERRMSVQNPNPNCTTGACAILCVNVKLIEGNEGKENEDGVVQIGSGDGEGNVEAFVGDNSSKERSTSESTPCSFIRDIDTAGTPGSNASASSPVDIKKGHQKSPNKLMPDANEVEEFLDGAEQQQHRQFIEKYNFDPVKDMPLPGRYNWVKKTDYA